MSNYITIIREYYQISQAELAQLLGLSRSSISMLEGDYRSAVDLNGNKNFVLLYMAMLQLKQKQASELEVAISIESEASQDKTIRSAILKAQYQKSLLERKLQIFTETNVSLQTAITALEYITNTSKPEAIDETASLWLILQIRLKKQKAKKINPSRIKLIQAQIIGLEAKLKELERA